MNIFEELRAEHDEQRELVKALTETEGKSEERQSLFERLKTSLAAHAASEERYFYKVLIDHDHTLEKARHSIAEHKELDDYLETLETTDMSSPGWLVTCKQLAHRLIHHLDEEEHEVFQVAGKVLEEQEKQALAAEYREYMDELAKAS